jgi:5-methylcytosine-specific restriction endonuclease McrA
MSYSTTLDEIPIERIRDELYLREKRFNRGQCSYCGHPFGQLPNWNQDTRQYDEPYFVRGSCKEASRHRGDSL